MEIRLQKINHLHHRVTLLREDGSGESFMLDTDPYLHHDLVHFVTEGLLHYHEGFWGMLAAGYALNGLAGKQNADTEALRFIERIVGPVSMVCLGHINADAFAESVQHLDFTLPEGFLDQAVQRVRQLMDHWGKLPFEGIMVLQWP